MLRDISFISKLRTNLISLGQLPEIGHRVVMDDAEITVSKKYPPRLIMCVQRKANKLYKIELKSIDSTCLLASLGDQGWLWHGMLGHANFQALRKLVDKEIVGGVPPVWNPDQVYQSSLATKQTRAPFPQSTHWRADEPLELVHVD